MCVSEGKEEGMRIIEAGYKKVYVGDTEEIARAVADIYAAILKAKLDFVIGLCRV